MKLFLVEWNYNDGDSYPTYTFVGVFDSLDKIPKEIKEYKCPIYLNEWDKITHRRLISGYSDAKVYFELEPPLIEKSSCCFLNYCYYVTEIEINKVIKNYN